MADGMPLDQMPDQVVDDFEKAGTTAEGPMKVRLMEWKYNPPGAGYDVGMLVGKFAVLERPGVGPVDENLIDTFFLNANALWKLTNMAEAMQLHYEGKTNFKDVAQDCVGRECFAFCTHAKGKNDGRIYTRLTAFGANLSEIMEDAPSSSGEGPRGL